MSRNAGYQYSSLEALNGITALLAKKYGF